MNTGRTSRGKRSTHSTSIVLWAASQNYTGEVVGALDEEPDATHGVIGIVVYSCSYRPGPV